MAWQSLAELMCSMCEIRLCSPSQIDPSFTSQGGLVAGIVVVVVVVSIVVVVVVSIVVVEVQGISVVVPSVPIVVVPAVVVSIVVPMVVSGMGGQGHSEKEGELGPQMQSGHSSTKSQLGEFRIARQ